MKTMNIGGTFFQVIKPRTNKVQSFTGWLCDENAIFYVYDRPSDTKISIWRNWCKWARNTEGVFGMEISGHNCMSFTIDGGYIDPNNGKEYRLYIAKTRNVAYEV